MQIWVSLIYPSDFHIEDKDILLSEIELNALMNSGMVGSEGRYFEIENKIFEDTVDDRGSVVYKVSIMLK